MDRLIHVESKMDFVLMESCKGYMSVNMQHLDNSKMYMNQQLAPYMMNLETSIQQRKSEFVIMKKERADDKMIQIDRQRKGRYLFLFIYFLYYLNFFFLYLYYINRYFPLVEILGESKLDLLNVICDDSSSSSVNSNNNNNSNNDNNTKATSSSEENLIISITILDAFGLMQSLIKLSIEREVEATPVNSPQTLFRLNSISTRYLFI